jgi:hypothetical protein
MHLSPVKAVVQLRPNFHHYDATLVGKKKGEEGARAPRPVQVFSFPGIFIDTPSFQ